MLPVCVRKLGCDNIVHRMVMQILFILVQANFLDGAISNNIQVKYFRETWGRVRYRLLRLLPVDCAQTSNFEFINLI